MTAQFQERLIIDGTEHRLHSAPLEPFLDTLGVRPKFDENGWTTALYRGYVGTWEITNKRLYLIGLKDCFGDAIEMGRVLPHQTPPVYALWYSGKLIVPVGKQITYVHHGWQSEYERDWMFTVRSGLIVKRRERDNVKSLARRLSRNPNYMDAIEESGPVPLLGWLTDDGRELVGLPRLEPRPLDEDSAAIEVAAALVVRTSSKPANGVPDGRQD